MPAASASIGRRHSPALDKVEEEVGELRQELSAASVDQARMEDEIGDLLFALVNVARLANVEAETALRRASAKFERRFRRVEALLAEQGTTPEKSTLAEMDALWDKAKVEERS